MNKIYKKNEVTFAIILIVIYVVGTSLAESLSASIGVEKLVPAIFHLVFTGVVLGWILKNGYGEKYGLILPKYKLKRAWFFLPLIIIACVDMIAGFEIRFSVLETVLFIISMLCVGFLEEIIFRGFLFVGMAKNNVRAAIIVSSITFGIGHIVNLFNGQNLPETILQIVFAIAVGFTLVGLFYKGKSLIPCIIFHGVNNALSAITKDNAEAAKMFSMSESMFELVFVSILIVISLLYALYIMRKADLSEEKNGVKSSSDT